MRPLLLTAIIVGVLAVSVTAPRPDKYFLETGDGLTKHHIIPGNRLSAFYDTARQHESKAVQEGLKETVQHIAKTNSYNGKGKDKLRDIRNGKGNFNKYTLSQFYWMPGNLFKGPSPKNRLDDANDEFEPKARYIIPDESFRNLHDINEGMKAFIKSKTPQDFLAVNEMIKQVHRSEPYPFDQSQWSGDVNGMRAIKTTPSSSPSGPRHSRPSSPSASRHSRPHSPSASQTKSKTTGQQRYHRRKPHNRA